MMAIDVYASAGYVLELLARSPYHRPFPFRRYFEVEILPPLQSSQARFYLTPGGIPTGFVSWAFLDEATLDEILSTGRALRAGEWACGENLFFNDFIAPYGTLPEIIKDLKTNMFPGRRATSIRRHSDGSIRSVKRWRGTG